MGRRLTEIPQPAELENKTTSLTTHEQVAVRRERKEEFLVIINPQGSYQEGDKVRIRPKDSESG